jgi:site-specific DNA-methyltransferase (adenine-specific)
MAGLPDESVDLIVTDPPYGIEYDTPAAGITIAADWNFQITPFFNEAARILKPGSAMYVCSRWDVYPVWLQFLPRELALQNVIVWDKKGGSLGDLTGNFGYAYEVILFIVKGRHRLRSKRYRNVWTFSGVHHSQRIHPTEKPVALFERMVESSSDEGGLVLDPFAGSGVLGAACKNLGRNALLCDMDPTWIRAMEIRLGLVAETMGPDDSVRINEDPLSGLHPEDLHEIRAYLDSRKRGAALKKLAQRSS